MTPASVMKRLKAVELSINFIMQICNTTIRCKNANDLHIKLILRTIVCIKVMPMHLCISTKGQPLYNVHALKTNLNLLESSYLLLHVTDGQIFDAVLAYKQLFFG